MYPEPYPSRFSRTRMYSKPYPYWVRTKYGYSSIFGVRMHQRSETIIGIICINLLELIHSLGNVNRVKKDIYPNGLPPQSPDVLLNLKQDFCLQSRNHPCSSFWFLFGFLHFFLLLLLFFSAEKIQKNQSLFFASSCAFLLWFFSKNKIKIEILNRDTLFLFVMLHLLLFSFFSLLFSGFSSEFLLLSQICFSVFFFDFYCF